MHKFLKALGLSQHIVQHISSLWHEVAMRQARLLPVKQVMAALLLKLNQVEIMVKYILVYMHQGHTTTKHLKDKGETPKVMLHKGHINETTTICIPT